MTTRNYTDERRWAKFDHSESRTRIRQHVNTPYEYVYGAFIHCLRFRDYESAELLKTHLRCVEEGGERVCGLCSAKAEEERKAAA